MCCVSVSKENFNAISRKFDAVSVTEIMCQCDRKISKSKQIKSISILPKLVEHIRTVSSGSVIWHACNSTSIYLICAIDSSESTRTPALSHTKWQWIDKKCQNIWLLYCNGFFSRQFLNQRSKFKRENTETLLTLQNEENVGWRWAIVVYGDYYFYY